MEGVYAHTTKITQPTLTINQYTNKVHVMPAQTIQHGIQIHKSVNVLIMINNGIKQKTLADALAINTVILKTGLQDVSHAPLAVIQGHIGVMVNVYVMIRTPMPPLYGFMNLTESISAIALLEHIGDRELV